jgi:spore maturation protein CgeB
MINETVVLLSPYEDCSNHRLAKYVIYLKSTKSIPFDICFYQPLQKIFTKVVLYDYLKRAVEVGIQEVNKEIIEIVRKEHPKYVLWLAIGEYYEIQESTFDTIRQERAKVVGWFFDDGVRFDYYSKWWISHLDYFVTDDIQAMSKYKALGKYTIQAIATGNSVERNCSKSEEQYDVSFVGSWRADREEHIGLLRSKGIPVNLFGEAGNRFVTHKEMVDIFGASKINLNFSKTYKYGKFGIKARIFEICLAGGFLLTEYAPGMERFFEIGKEIVCFRNPQEMIDKIIYYLNHEEARRIIAKAGWERASKEYTSFHIMLKVFRKIEKYSTNDKKSKLQKLIMPMSIRKRVSKFYRMWGEAFLLENYKGLWKDSLSLSLVYNPLDIRVQFSYTVGFLPVPLRCILIQPYVTAIKLRKKLITVFTSMPMVKIIYHKLKKRLTNI